LRRNIIGAVGGAREGVIVCRHLADVERYRFLAPLLSLEIARTPGSGAKVRRHPALQVGQREGGRAVAAIHGAEQGEQRGVLRNRENLAVALGPPPWREAEPERLDLPEKWFHLLPPVPCPPCEPPSKSSCATRRAQPLFEYRIPHGAIACDRGDSIPPD